MDVRFDQLYTLAVALINTTVAVTVSFYTINIAQKGGAEGGGSWSDARAARNFPISRAR